MWITLCYNFRMKKKVRLKTFYDYIIEENEKFNITNITDETEFYVKNVADSLYGCEFLEKGKSVVEIGSGGGFPSVPIKIEREDLKFTLVESNAKKCGFLQRVREKLRFDDFIVICARSEDLAAKSEYRESFDHGVARAVAPMNILCELILPLIKVGGTAVIYKGKNYEEELKAAENAIKTLGATVSAIKTYSLERGFGDRAIIVLKKIKNSDGVYPRKYAKIKNHPL